MAVVKQANGEGHAVLMVRTDRGDLVLDNQVGSVDLWNAHALQVHQAPVARPMPASGST